MHVIDQEENEVGTVFHTEGGDFLLEYFPLTQEEKAAEKASEYYEPWYADFPGQRQPVRYRLTTPNGDVDLFWAAGDDILGPVFTAIDMAHNIILVEK